MDTLRLVGGAVVAYLGVVLVLGSIQVLPDAIGTVVGFAAANATEPVVVVNAVIGTAAFLIVALALRRR